MNKISLILLFITSINTQAFFKEWSFGAGTLSEHYDKIEEEIGGDRTKFEFNPYASLRGEMNFPFISGYDLLTEVGLTLPRSSRDSAVSETNYWLNFLIAPTTSFIIRPHIGLGFYFTRLSMDGAEQDLSNGGSPATFQTPEGASTAGNNVLVLGLDIQPSNQIYLKIQGMILNAEDSEERSSNILLSAHMSMGAL